MHRSIELSVPAAASAPLIDVLRAMPDVIGLSRHAGASIVPAGDIISVHVLNRSADAVLRATEQACGSEQFSVVTAEVASISDKEHQTAIDADVDEAIWEELETGLRHQGRLTTNFLLLMALGGAIAAVGAMTSPSVALVAYIASAIIAPGFEPVAKLPLGLILGRTEVLKAGLISTCAGYAVLIAAAAATWLVLSQFGVEASAFLEGEAVRHTLHPTPEIYGVSLAGAFAGIIIIAAYRQSVIAGALVAMRLIEAASVTGVAIAMGQMDIALGALARLCVDFAFVAAAGLIVFGLKQVLLHRRAPLR
jgi:hypothetical protein